ncbi:MAG: 16S rRNA (guanine(966)-N(2))-methyltransferase RsmD [Mariprofundaceae bacterium]
MRITAGFLKGRRLTVPNIAGVRPTPSRAREALFNILGDIEDWAVLDLFSGSGLMALEAISRGAAHVTSIEQNGRICRHLQQLREQWKLTDRWKITQAGVEHGLEGLEQLHFDLIFADPPYQQGFLERIPCWLDTHRIRCGQLIIEESARTKAGLIQGWTITQSRRYGDTCLNFLEQEKA